MTRIIQFFNMIKRDLIPTPRRLPTSNYITAIHNKSLEASPRGVYGIYVYQNDPDLSISLQTQYKSWSGWESSFQETIAEYDGTKKQLMLIDPPRLRHAVIYELVDSVYNALLTSWAPEYRKDQNCLLLRYGPKWLRKISICDQWPLPMKWDAETAQFYLW